MTIHPLALISMFFCFLSVGVIMHYEQRIEVIELTAKMQSKHNDHIKYYSRCLNTSIDMVDVKGCIGVHNK